MTTETGIEASNTNVNFQAVTRATIRFATEVASLADSEPSATDDAICTSRVCLARCQ